MTDPRIQSAPQFTNIHTYDGPSFQNPPPVEAESTNQDLLDAITDSFEEFAAPLLEGSEALVNNAAICANVDEQIAQLEVGQTAIVRGQLSGSVHAGLGAEASGGLEMTVTRKSEVDYEARVEWAATGGFGLGAEAFDLGGGSVDLSRSKGARLTLTGQGPGAVEELARLTNVTEPGDLLNTIANRDHVSVARIELADGAGLSAGGALGVKGSVSNDHKSWSGLDFKEGGIPIGGFRRMENSRTISVSTPRVQLESTDDEVAVARMFASAYGLDVNRIPREIVASALEAGVPMGVNLEATNTSSIEARLNTERGFEIQIENTTQLRAGATTYVATQSAVVSVEELDVKWLGKVVDAESPQEFLDVLAKAGIKASSSFERKPFEGMDIDVPFVSAKCGVESSFPVYSLTGGIH